MMNEPKTIKNANKTAKDESGHLTRFEFLARCGQGALASFCLWAFSRLGLNKAVAKVAKAAPPAESPAALPFTLTQTATLDPARFNLSKPLGLAIDAKDQLYIAGAEGIKVFNRAAQDAQLIRNINIIGKTGGPVCAVTLDPAGQVYVARRTRIEKFDADGKPLNTWGKDGKAPGEFTLITSIAADARYVYVADAGARRVSRFATDGDFIDELTGFQIPSPYFDCAFDTNGVFSVANTGRHRVERYDENGKLLGSWGKYGPALADFCGCCNPTNFAFFADGRIATTEKGLPRLKVYRPDGKLLACLGGEAFTRGTAGMDVAVDSQGRIALLDPIAGKVRFYELKESAKTMAKQANP